MRTLNTPLSISAMEEEGEGFYGEDQNETKKSGKFKM